LFRHETFGARRHVYDSNYAAFLPAAFADRSTTSSSVYIFHVIIKAATHVYRNTRPPTTRGAVGRVVKKAHPPPEGSFDSLRHTSFVFFVYAISERVCVYIVVIVVMIILHKGSYMYCTRLDRDSENIVRPRKGESGKMFVLFPKGKHVKAVCALYACVCVCVFWNQNEQNNYY